MTQAYTGGCACGAIRFHIAAEPLFQNHCQCRDCQHKSGTGHGSYLSFPRQGVEQTGAATRWDIVADSGHVKTRAFCPTCGSLHRFVPRPGAGRSGTTRVPCRSCADSRDTGNRSGTAVRRR